ncbi:unnamed protein product, partial [marine sediment metagenome]
MPDRTSRKSIDDLYAQLLRRLGSIDYLLGCTLADAFKAEGVKFALEVHPTEIAFDIASAQRALKAIRGHKSFGFNYDPSHLGYQGVDYVKFIRTFG